MSKLDRTNRKMFKKIDLLNKNKNNFLNQTQIKVLMIQSGLFSFQLFFPIVVSNNYFENPKMFFL